MWNTNRTLRQRIVPILLGLLLLLPIPASALDDDAYDGYAADTLTIEVGYFGGPYYEKRVFTTEELWNLPLVREDYTFIDNMPSVVIDHVVGVRLDDLMAEAGIDVNSIETFRFWTVDKTSDYYTQYPKNELLDTTRYCYYSLPDNFDSESGTGLPGADAVATPVPTVMALADDWNRCIQGADFGSDYEHLNTATRFRLIFGQVDTVTRTAQRSAKWVHKIEVTLGGAPTITVDTADLEMEVGSVRRVQAQIRAADSLIAEGADASVVWSSSDESVATVDPEGNVTMVGEGTAVITVTAGSASTSFVVRSTAPQEEEEETEPAPEPEETPETSSEEEPPAEEMPVEEVTPDRQPEAMTLVPGTVGSLRRGDSGSSSGSGNAASFGSASSADSGVTRPQQETTAEPEPQKDEETPSAGVQAQEVTLDSGTPLELQELEVSEAGGVQNWRIFEMSEAAQELPEIETDNPLLGFTGAASGIIFAAGGVTEYVLYRRRFY